MKLKLPVNLLKALYAAFIATSASLYAGTMHYTIDTQLYRDLAENRGIYYAGSTAAMVFYNNGWDPNPLPAIPDFSSVCDGGHSTAIAASAIATVAHNGGFGNNTFSGRYIGSSNAIHYTGVEYRGDPNYRYTAWENTDIWGNGQALDHKVTRLNKIITDVNPAARLTDDSVLSNLMNVPVFRVGGGTQTVIQADGSKTTVAGGYAYLTAGFLNLTSANYKPQDMPGALPEYMGGSVLISYSISPSEGSVNAENPMPIKGESGDSGSPIFVWNENSQRYEYLGSHYASGGNNSYALGQETFVNTVLESLKDHVLVQGNEKILWGTATQTTDTKDGRRLQYGQGTLTQNGQTLMTYTGLGEGCRTWKTINMDVDNWFAYNATTTQNAAIEDLFPTRDLVFWANGTEQTIELQGSVDMGIGSLTFDARTDKNDTSTGQTAVYNITSAAHEYTLDSAGYIINSGVTVNSYLTGNKGDEWRKIGDGSWNILGNGNNNASLNIGGSGTVYLGRTNGYAAYNVLVNNGATLKLANIGQIKRDLTFGNGGGTLDLNGNSYEWNNATAAANGQFTLHILDANAVIANLKANSTSTLLYTQAGNTVYQGGFRDDIAHGALLNVVYDGGTGSSLKLTGTTTRLGGTMDVRSGQVIMAGTNTIHAGNYINPDDWHYAYAAMNIQIGNEGTFTLGDHARLDGDISVKNGGTFVMTHGVNKSLECIEGTYLVLNIPQELYGLHGNVALETGGLMHINMVNTYAPELAYSGNISGQGNFLKTGGSGIHLQGNNTFSGTKTIENGYVRGSSLASMGNTSANKWKIGEQGVLLVENVQSGQALADVLPIIDRTSTGVVALTGNQDHAIDLSTHAGLIIGAANGRTVDYGQSGTSETLAAVNGGWILGGGGGTLNLNLRLEDGADGTARKLTVGNQYGSGTVVLTNANNTFSGGIDVKGRIILDYTDIAALGSGQVNLAYGTMASLGNTPQLMIGKTSAASEGILLIKNSGTSASFDLDMSSKPSASLGAWGNVRYDGNITVGTNAAYRFGGDGTLILGQALAANGTNSIIVDSQGTQGGIVALAAASGTTGNVIVRGNRDQSAAGSITLRLDTDHALDMASGTSVQLGGAIDLNGHATALRDLDLAGGIVGNTAAAAAALGLEFVTRTELKGGLTGKLDVTYRSSLTGAVTLSGANTFTGTATLASGTYNLAAAGAFGSNANTLAIAQGATLNITSQIALGQKLTGTGTLNLNVAMSGNLLTNAASDFRGTLNLNAGRHTFSQGNIGAGCTIVINEGAQAYLSGTFDNNFILNSTGWNASDVAKAGALRVDGGTINGNITMMKSVSIGAYNGAATINGNIIGEGYDLTKLYGNTLTLNAASNNTFRNLNINGGTLTVSGAATAATAGTALGTGTVTLAGGTTLNLASSAASAEYTYANGFVFNANSKLNITGGSQTLTGTVKLNGATAIDTEAGTTLTLSGQLSGTAQLTKNGTGTLVLSGNNTGKTGNLVISSGTLRAIGTNALGTMNTTLASGTILDLGGSGITNLDLHGATLTLAGQNTLLYNTALSGGACLIDSLASVNLVASGTVTIGLDSTAGLNLGSYTLIDSTRTLDLGTFSLAGAPAQSRTKVALALGGTNNNQLILNVTGGMPENVVWKGTGTLETTVANTANITSSDSTYYNFDSLTLAEQNPGTTASHTLTIGGSGIAPSSVTVTGHDNYTIAGAAISGSSSLTKEGSGTLTLAAGNSYTGGTDIRQGIVNAQAAGALGTGNITVRAGGILKAADTALAGNSLTLDGGLAEMSAAGISKAGAVTMKNNGTWLLTAAGTATGTINIAAGDTGSINTNGKNLTWNGTLFGEGTLAKQGAGTIILGKTQNTAWAGTIDVSQGTLQLGIDKNTSVSILGRGRINIASGATLALKSGTATYAADLAFANGSTFAVYDGAGGTLAAPSYKLTGDVTLGGKLNVALTWGKITELSGTISDAAAASGSISITGSSETPVLILSGTNTFTGGVTLNSAATQLCITNSQSLGTGNFTFTQGTLRWKNYQGGTAGDIILNGTAGTRAFNTDAATITISNAITGNGSLTKTGTGTLRIDGSLSHTGGTNIAQGTLALRFNGAATDIQNNIDIAQNAALAIETTARLNGNISGNGELRIEQGAIAIMNAANTFTGTVNTIGTTVLNHQQAAANAGISLNGQDQQHKASLLLSTNNTTIGGLSGNKHSVVDAGDTSGQPVVAPPRRLNIASAVNTTFSGTVTGSVAIIKTGIGTLALDGASLIGSITLNDIQSTLSLSNTTLAYIGTGNDPKIFALQGTLTLDNSNSIDISQLAYHTAYVTFLTGTDTATGTGLVLTNDVRDLSIRLNIAIGHLDTEKLAGTSFTVDTNSLPAWLAGLDTNTYTLQFDDLGDNNHLAYITLTGQGRNPSATGMQAMFSPRLATMAYNTANGTASIPEPSSAVLILLGAAGLLARRRRAA